MYLQPEDMAGVTTHPSEDTGSTTNNNTNNSNNKDNFFYTLIDLRKYLIKRLSIRVLPTNAFWQNGYKYSSNKKIEMFTGDLLRVKIIPSRGPFYWTDNIIVQGDGGFYYKRFKINRKGEVTFSTTNHLTSKKSKNFKLEISYKRDIKNG